MPALSKTLVASLAASCSSLILPSGINGDPFFTNSRYLSPKHSHVSMVGANSDATRDSEPQVSQGFDNGMSGWKPPSGGGGGHSLGGSYEATDTPDFMPEEGSRQAELAAGISYSDGLLGSQAQNMDKNRDHDPGVKGALDVNPDIYVPDVEEIVADESQFVLPSSGMTDMDFDMFTSSMDDKDLEIPVRPVCMTFEDFYCGFTADSDPAFTVTPSSGSMERRNGPPTVLQVNCNPRGRSGTLVGYLCFILPDEKAFSTYYKITCESR